MGKKALTFGIWHGLLTRMAVHACVCVLMGRWGEMGFSVYARDCTGRMLAGRWWASSQVPRAANRQSGKAQNWRPGWRAPTNRLLGWWHQWLFRAPVYNRRWDRCPSLSDRPTVALERHNTKVPASVRRACGEKSVCVFVVCVCVARAPRGLSQAQGFLPVTCPSDGKFHFIPHHSLSFF